MRAHTGEVLMKQFKVLISKHIMLTDIRNKEFFFTVIHAKISLNFL